MSDIGILLHGRQEKVNANIILTIMLDTDTGNEYNFRSGILEKGRREGSEI